MESTGVTEITIDLFCIREIQEKFPLRIKEKKLLLRNKFENYFRKMLSGNNYLK